MNAMIDRTTTSAPEGKAPAAAWYALAVLIGTTLFAFVDRQIINLVSPSFQKMLGLSDFQLGALQGLGLALFASAAGYPIGWLADRFGRRLVLGCCILVWSISTAACAFQNSFVGLFATTAGIAIGEAALAPIIFSMLPDLFPERQRNTANFIFFAAVLLGAAAGLGLGGATLDWLANNHQALPGALATMDSWRVALIIAAVPAPLFMLLLTTVRLRGHSGHVANADAADLHRVFPFLRVHWRTLACIFGAITAYGLPLNSAFIWLPIAMPRIFGVDPADVGMQLGATVAIGTVIGLILPALGTRLLRNDPLLSPLRLGRVFLALAILPTAFLLVASSPWQIYAAASAQLMLGLATGALMPGVLQQVTPPAMRSRVISIMGIVTAIGTGVSPVLVGAVSGFIDGPRGILTAIVIVGVPGWVLGTLFLTLARRHFLTTVATIKGDAVD
jgi:MFS family permease